MCSQKNMWVSTCLYEDSWSDQWEMPCDKPLDTHTRGSLRRLILIEYLTFAGVYTHIWFNSTNPHVYRGKFCNPFYIYRLSGFLQCNPSSVWLQNPCCFHSITDFLLIVLTLLALDAAFSKQVMSKHCIKHM